MLRALRQLFNNGYNERGSTEYFIGKQGNGSTFAVTYGDSTHSMLDWGEFTVLDEASRITASDRRLAASMLAPARLRFAVALPVVRRTVPQCVCAHTRVCVCARARARVGRFLGH